MRRVTYAGRCRLRVASLLSAGCFLQLLVFPVTGRAQSPSETLPIEFVRTQAELAIPRDSLGILIRVETDGTFSTRRPFVDGRPELARFVQKVSRLAPRIYICICLRDPVETSAETLAAVIRDVRRIVKANGHKDCEIRVLAYVGRLGDT